MTEAEGTDHSPAGLEAPEVELNDHTVVCAGCETKKPASEMGVTGDEVTKNDVGDVLAVTRYYLCNDKECMTAFRRKMGV